MNKFNVLGMEVLDYKTEYLKDYPKLVHDSIGLAIDTKSDVEDDIKAHLKDMDLHFDDFKAYLLTQKSCLKTYEQLLTEYEVIRKSIDDKLASSEVGKELKSMSKVEEEIIQVQQKFIISDEFIREYFSIADDKEFESLMTRKGFIEKFAILRLTKIFDDFLKNLEADNDIKIKHTLVFFDSEHNVYGIHLEYDIPIDLLEETVKVDAISKAIIDISEKADKNYKDRMLV